MHIISCHKRPTVKVRTGTEAQGAGLSLELSYDQFRPVSAAQRPFKRTRPARAAGADFFQSAPIFSLHSSSLKIERTRAAGLRKRVEKYVVMKDKAIHRCCCAVVLQANAPLCLLPLPHRRCIPLYSAIIHKRTQDHVPFSFSRHGFELERIGAKKL